MDLSLLFIVVGALNLGLGDGRQEGLGEGIPDVPSVNNVGDKPAIAIDPKLRRALLRVLSKLEQEDKEKPPSDDNAELPGDQILSLFGHKANTEDLGSVEASKEVVAEKEANQDDLSPDFNYIPPPTEPAVEAEEVKSPEKYPPTSPTPQVVYIPYPTPLQAPEQEESPKPSEKEEDEPYEEEGETVPPTENLVTAEEDEETPENETTDNESDNDTEEKTLVDSSSSISETYEGEAEIKKKNGTAKKEKHTVEFFTSDLVAAFTVQQDDRGIPRKVIPLEYSKPGGGPIIKVPDAAQRQRELAERKAQLEQELRLLRQQQEAQERELARLRSGFPGEQRFRPEADYFPQIQNSDRFLQEEARRKQQEILLGQQRQFELQRQRELERQREQERQRELERQREQERQRNLYRQQELQRQQYLQDQERQRLNVDFQRSVDYHLDHRARTPFPTQNLFNYNSNYQAQFVPGIELNRVNRQEGNRVVGNFGFNRIPPSPDRQLQNLFLQSGLSSSGAKDDLSIVSKVLALNHGAEYFPVDLAGRHSEQHGFYVTQPSTYVQPPKH